MKIILKHHVAGNIKPRWPKTKVVKWLEWGAIPAIVGLWIPDWSGSYIQQLTKTNQVTEGWQAFPPLLMFVGAIILFKACTEGVKNMGWHYRGVLISGYSAIAFAGASLLFHSLISTDYKIFSIATILSIILAAFFAASFLWFTIAKVAEISSETRTQTTKYFVSSFATSALITGIISVILFYHNNQLFPFTFRLSIILFTICFAFCRYGVYCYKTQKSIGAIHTIPPDNQFWI